MADQQQKKPDLSKTATHGRGGAGNISNKPMNAVGANDLETPTIKSQLYTTGRGGSGNMAANVSPEEARKAQDIDTPAHHKNEPKGTYHWGRGGEGNMMTVGQKEGEKEEKNGVKGSPVIRPADGQKRSGSFRDAFGKGKEMLGLKGKGEKGGNGSAVED
ncbi:uncharacterized protein LTR77_002248 [Saxophila tyrrhenica]|uniref:Uncharacterized protein n=1 Tax=Saxophila tyrrhenica TaxID=1690608 RepID=A0AAV9PID8_9PEZI|nr:hypothetical protein LTR77_002248 [Saxophila tyrrhenica]